MKLRQMKNSSENMNTFIHWDPFQQKLWSGHCSQDQHSEAGEAAEPHGEVPLSLLPTVTSLQGE